MVNQNLKTQKYTPLVVLALLLIMAVNSWSIKPKSIDKSLFKQLKYRFIGPVGNRV
ncbi:MAG: hypothetical protein GY757_10495, partial [bacterium]|nr:hypothetical protein [bacterium]